MDRVIGRDRGTHFRGVRAWALCALLFTAAACGDDTPAPSAPRLPKHVTAAIWNSRIGEGVPSTYRQAGIEHNRLTLLTAQKLRGESAGYRDAVKRCAGVQRVLFAEIPRTAQAVGASGREGLLRKALDRTFAGLEGCPGSLSSFGSVLSAETTTAAVEGDSVAPSQAAFDALDRLEAAIRAATERAQVEAAVQEAAAAATVMPELDAAAVYSAVAQTQASIVLWEPGGSGWVELSNTQAFESLFGLTASDGWADWLLFKKVIAADLVGCVGAMRFLRMFPIVQDPRLLIGACGLGAAGLSIVTAWEDIFGDK